MSSKSVSNGKKLANAMLSRTGSRWEERGFRTASGRATSCDLNLVLGKSKLKSNCTLHRPHCRVVNLFAVLILPHERHNLSGDQVRWKPTAHQQ